MNQHIFLIFVHKNAEGANDSMSIVMAFKNMKLDIKVCYHIFFLLT